MVQGHPPLVIEELPKEDEERLEKLFSKLDNDGNGKIDIHDLSVALKELAPHINRSYAEVRNSLHFCLRTPIYLQGTLTNGGFSFQPYHADSRGRFINSEQTHCSCLKLEMRKF